MRTVVATLFVLFGCGDISGQGAVANVETFAYDRSAALGVELLNARTTSNQTVYDLRYTSPKGGTVTGLLAVPKGAGPFAGIIVQHGMPQTADDMRADIDRFASAGAVVVAINAPWNRRGGSPLMFTPQDSVEQVQIIVELQRAVDLLIARDDVDPTRLGYFGYSYGAAMGALLAGVERRLVTYILTGGDGGLVSHVTGPDDAGRQPAPEAQFKRWLAAMEPIEPIRFVGRAAPASILFQSGTLDVLVPPADARDLHNAASNPKEVRWYETGHDMNQQAVEDRVAWFVSKLRMTAVAGR